MSKFNDAIRLIRENADTAEGRAELADRMVRALECTFTGCRIAGGVLDALGFVRYAWDDTGIRHFTIRRSAKLAGQLAQAAAAAVRDGKGPLAD